MHGLTVAVLAAALGLYLLGVARLWRRAGAGRAIRLPHLAAFGAGWLVASRTKESTATSAVAFSPGC